MPHVVCQPCIGNKCTNCVLVCPVAAFREDSEMVVIDPRTCIDCGACVPECPVNAIYADDEVPDQWKSYIPLNADKAKDLPVIIEKK